MNRRHFIRITSLTTASLPLLNFDTNAAPLQRHVTTPGDLLFQRFTAPENIHRPFVRWWWNGDRVEEKEILRELDVMKEAGIGGVEINPVRWNENADAVGIEELSWGSDQWLDRVEVAVKGAKERNLVCDMIIGSGWPFGGEFVPREEQCQIILVGAKPLTGNKKYEITQKELLDDIVPPSNRPGHIKELFMVRLTPAQMNEFTPGVDVNFREQSDTLTVDVPAGDHILYYLVKATGYQSVLQGALGANGPVINHYDKAAVQHYLDHFAATLSKKLGALSPWFRAFFTDSIELQGANWCPDMYEQFKRRRGYDLAPYFPYILHKIEHMGSRTHEQFGAQLSPAVRVFLERVNYDFEQTRLELFKEHFIDTFTAWCRKLGVRSRMQAYGMDCNAIEASMEIDIPECETWIFDSSLRDFGREMTGRDRDYTMSNKFVSSAAHLAGKQLISCEETTNTGDIFGTTLERIKLSGDESNLSGVTHSILHGFNYSPLEAPFPGWVRYGNYFNERNTWWPYFKLWADYKARISALLQNAVMQADIAILHPLADLASKHGYQRDPFPALSYPSYVHQVWEPIHQAGNGCDYVTEKIIQQAKKGKGILQYNQRSYKALLLIEVETIEPATAKAIQQFAKGGGKVIFVGKTPYCAPGLINHARNSRSVSAATQAILKNKSTAGIVPAPVDNLLEWYLAIQQQFSLKPYLQMSSPVHYVSQLYYKTGNNDLFYIINYHPEHTHQLDLSSFNANPPQVWDAEAGERYQLKPDSNGLLSLSLGPLETKLLVFDNSPATSLYAPVSLKGMDEKEVKGPWKLSLHHVNGTSRTIELDQLTDLQSRPDTANFAGTIVYDTILSAGNSGSSTFLSLGRIHVISELEVNGRAMGVRWYGHHIYDVTEALRPGENYCKIKIVTTLGAYTRSLKKNKAAQEWGGGEPGAVGLVEPVKLFIKKTS